MCLRPACRLAVAAVLAVLRPAAAVAQIDSGVSVGRV
jgi:hypothetical protein